MVRYVSFMAGCATMILATFGTHVATLVLTGNMALINPDPLVQLIYTMLAGASFLGGLFVTPWIISGYVTSKIQKPV